jgi:hypothetical protein
MRANTRASAPQAAPLTVKDLVLLASFERQKVIQMEDHILVPKHIATQCLINPKLIDLLLLQGGQYCPFILYISSGSSKKES